MQELKRQNIYFASYVNNMIGKPDIVFRRKKIVVFIDSDFWHGHPTRCVYPKTNQEYWQKKISRNRERDKEVNLKLSHNGWKVVRLWEFDIYYNFKRTIGKLLKAIER